MSNTNVPSKRSDEASDAVEQIAHIREAHASAEADGTFETVADHVDEDLVVAMPGHEPIEGRDAWAARFDEMMANAPAQEYEIRYDSDETIVSGDLAVDRGTCADSAVDEDGEEHHTEYNYLMVFQRTGDGTWKQTRTIWNKIE